MLPAGARAIVLLLGGVQVWLPGPAFVEQGRVWFPARAVLERIGYRVRWDGARREVQISEGGSPAALVLSEQQAAVTAEGSLASRRVQGLVYAPVVALRPLGIAFRYDGAARTVEILGQQAEPTPGSLSAILADPPSWTGRLVELSGEYLGWSPYPFCFPTASLTGAPVGDFVLRNEGGAICCHIVPSPSPPRSSLGAVGSERPPLTPYESIGRRLVLVGTLRLAADGRPELACRSVRRPTGIAGLTCLLRFDRTSYRPGQQATGTLIVANPDPTAVELPLGSSSVQLTIAAPDGDTMVTRVVLDGLTGHAAVWRLGPEQRRSIACAWTIPAQAASGEYRAVAQVTEGLQSYPAAFRVDRPPSPGDTEAGDE
jgi:hypothetical protein